MNEILKERERVCNRIAEIRKKKGVTQIQLAAESGFAQPNIARIEAGKNAVGIDMLILLAWKLGARVEIVENDV